MQWITLMRNQDMMLSELRTNRNMFELCPNCPPNQSPVLEAKQPACGWRVCHHTASERLGEKKTNRKQHLNYQYIFSQEFTLSSVFMVNFTA